MTIRDILSRHARFDMRELFSVWGCGNGLLKSLQPHARIISGLLVGCSCIIMPLRSSSTVALMILVTASWCALAAMPAKMISKCFIASLILYCPYMILTPWITVDSMSGSPMIERIAHAGAIALRSMCTFFVAASTVAALSISDVHHGLARLPLPNSIVAFVVQLINQTMLLLEETRRIITVLRLRGITGVKGINVLFSFPVVWMIRMLFRAERTAAAMTIRGYGIETVSAFKSRKSSKKDLLIIFAAVWLLCVSLFLTFGTY